MGRSLAAFFALALAAPVLLSSADFSAMARASERTLPMRFALRLQGPAAECGAKCRLLITASGAITADTPRDFKTFAQGRDLTGATVVLDSDGGSVHGAIALGRDIRHLNLDTTVGRVVDLESADKNVPRASLTPRADCESMCAFVLLAGVHRTMPPQARVMVHQIWLGDRRDDPTAANYSAEDLVLVQRDIGLLARYTVDMGGSIELLDMSLRIPPWEPMRALTLDEARRMRVATEEAPAPAAGPTIASSPSPPATARPLPRATDGAGATKISERRWAMIDRGGTAVLARRHPLTVEGEVIGSFDLIVACGNDRDGYDLSYVERRRGGGRGALPSKLGAVHVASGGLSATLKVVSSQRERQPDALVTYASGPAPATLITAFAGGGSHSLMIETTSARGNTGIRIGNTGAKENLPQLAAGCRTPIGNRAGLAVPKTGGAASAH